MEEYKEENPAGFRIGCHERQFQVGRIVNAALPIDWVPLITDPESRVQQLTAWCWQAEEAMFQQADSEEAYYLKLNELINYAIFCGRHYHDNGLCGPDHVAYWLSQYLTQVMGTVGTQALSSETSMEMLSMCVGMMDARMPKAAAEPLDWHSVIDVEFRQQVIFNLIQAVFPYSIDDGNLYSCPDLVEFGKTVEEELFQRSVTPAEYYAFIENMRRQLIEFRHVEDLAIKQQINFREQFFVNQMIQYLRSRGQQQNQ